MRYFFPSDNLYIELSNKKSPLGDEEFQDDVILHRDPKSNEIVGIEILHFKDFTKLNNYVQISKNKVIDMSTHFRFLRAFISLQDIMFIDPDEFEKIMIGWGYKKIKNQKLQNQINLCFDQRKARTKRIEMVTS